MKNSGRVKMLQICRQSGYIENRKQFSVPTPSPSAMAIANPSAMRPTVIETGAPRPKMMKASTI